MVAEKEEKSSPGFTPIRPVAVNLTAKSPAAVGVGPERYSKQHILIGLGFGVLLITAVVVIFLLPHWITSPAVEPAQVADPGQSGRTPPPVGSTPDSPWERAQQSKLRKETQEILARMLGAQKTLEEHGVTLWAGQEFAGALQHAADGDDLYNKQDFSQAHARYTQALTALSALVERMDEVFEETMVTANRALAAGDSATALAAFQIALAIDPVDRAVMAGIERARTLDAVIALINKGDRLLEDEQLEQAKTAYQQALDLDGNANRAGQQIQLAEQKIREREFNLHMSAGFSSLEINHLQQALDAFNQALKLRPKSAEARTALNQTRHYIATLKINSLLDQARDSESAERWQDALAKYNAALELDAGLADAQAGKERAGVRAKIEDKLEQILTHPERLYDQEIYNEMEAFHKKLSALSNPGPVLSRQLDRLAQLLTKAITPVSIRLQSDNLTRVTLHKIGELGYFTTRELSIRPGRYVAVGQRDGYRDVRVVINADADSPMPVITVQAREKIALGN